MFLTNRWKNDLLDAITFMFVSRFSVVLSCAYFGLLDFSNEHVRQEFIVSGFRFQEPALYSHHRAFRKINTREVEGRTLYGSIILTWLALFVVLLVLTVVSLSQLGG